MAARWKRQSTGIEGESHSGGSPKATEAEFWEALAARLSEAGLIVGDALTPPRAEIAGLMDGIGPKPGDTLI